MARKPSYPEDAPVGDPVGKEPTPPSEIVTDAVAKKAAGSNRTRNLVTGAALGIGSAALVAALLYANRSRSSDKPGKD